MAPGLVRPVCDEVLVPVPGATRARPRPLELLFVQEFADPYVELRQTGAAVITQPDLRWDRCDIKSTNLLANVLAMQSAVSEYCWLLVVQAVWMAPQ